MLVKHRYVIGEACVCYDVVVCVLCVCVGCAGVHLSGQCCYHITSISACTASVGLLMQSCMAVISAKPASLPYRPNHPLCGVHVYV